MPLSEARTLLELKVSEVPWFTMYGILYAFTLS
jgi:hypothetical protein